MKFIDAMDELYEPIKENIKARVFLKPHSPDFGTYIAQLQVPLLRHPLKKTSLGHLVEPLLFFSVLSKIFVA
jgi:hypothetical protein